MTVTFSEQCRIPLAHVAAVISSPDSSVLAVAAVGVLCGFSSVVDALPEQCLHGRAGTYLFVAAVFRTKPLLRERRLATCHRRRRPGQARRRQGRLQITPVRYAWPPASDEVVPGPRIGIRCDCRKAAACRRPALPADFQAAAVGARRADEGQGRRAGATSVSASGTRPVSAMRMGAQDAPVPVPCWSRMMATASRWVSAEPAGNI